MEAITYSYDLSLVILSIIVAISASSIALDISSRLNVASGVARTIWLLTGTLVMGLGIWSMHFIAMLALNMSIQVTYNAPIVIISIIPALISCGIAFYMTSKQIVKTTQLLIGAFFIGTGIISMHFIGMEAMQMKAEIFYNPYLWSLSVIIAYITSLAALYLLFFLREMTKFQWKKIGSAIIMGFAISGMHYTGMAAAMFHPTHQQHHMMGASLNNILLAYGIGIGMLMILGLTLIFVFVDRRLKAQSVELEKKFQSVIESANDAIILTDKMGTVTYWNKGANQLFEFTKEEVVGQDIQIIIPERYKEPHRKGMERYLSTKIPHVVGKTVELYGLKKDGSEFPIEMSLATWQTEKDIYFSSIIRDITERKLSEEKINSLVYLDPLTDLPNRRLLYDRLASVLDQSRINMQILSILFISLDRFKLINDTFGHQTGDLLLVDVTKRLKGCITKTDTLSRVGGDEFILLLTNTDYVETAKHAKEILDVLNKPFHLNGHDMFISSSIGISMFPSNGKDRETLIKNADLAMSRIKEQGKNAFQFFTPEMNETISRKTKLEIGLRKGLEQEEFNIYYQPQIEIKTGSLIGVEALIRWNHSELGFISPAEFIPLAEESGIIVDIGEWVIQKACNQNKLWQKSGFPPFRVAVNISARQFSQSNLTEIVNKALTDSGLDPKYLELELTESIIQNSKSAISTMHKLKSMGIHLSIDDFGTGYSSLSYLKQFPIDTLKIDQYFTRNIQEDVKDAALVDTIIKMAHNFELNVIAEGVETLYQLEFLKNRNCDQAQGYYFSKPLPVEEFERVYNSIKN
jgi:diguanylate cyclase